MQKIQARGDYMQSNTTCPLVEQYLNYLVVIKGRADNTVKEYRTDLLMFFNYIMNLRNITIIDENFAQADLEFIKSITLHDMYSFVSYCQKSLNSSPGTRAKKIVPIVNYGNISKLKLISLIIILLKN